jgi:F0F1-type ATP synthase assembly protein I
MSKLLVSLALVVLVFGVALFIFQGDAGVTEAVKGGHASVMSTVRSFDYVSD